MRRKKIPQRNMSSLVDKKELLSPLTYCRHRAVWELNKSLYKKQLFRAAKKKASLAGRNKKQNCVHPMKEWSEHPHKQMSNM